MPSAGAHMLLNSTRSLASDPAALAGISGRSSTSGPPQRGVLILPGLGNNAADYTKLADLLQDKGMAVQVAQIERIDWSRNAAALTNGELHFCSQVLGCM
jgi:NAD(P)H-hydrate repair Nnr-like enzyme with NAD(P)H-hydrate epimerase domain